MKLIYKNNEMKIVECKTFFSRFLGFMGKKEINHGILFDKCNSIHTFFMKTNIDVIMCDKNNTILYFYNNLSKNKIILPKKNVYKVIELPVNFFKFKLNDKIRIDL